MSCSISRSSFLLLWIFWYTTAKRIWSFCMIYHLLGDSLGNFWQKMFLVSGTRTLGILLFSSGISHDLLISVTIGIEREIEISVGSMETKWSISFLTFFVSNNFHLFFKILLKIMFPKYSITFKVFILKLLDASMHIWDICILFDYIAIFWW